MKIRSWLLVEPSADIAKIRDAGADRIVVDLAASVDDWKAVAGFCTAWAEIEVHRPPAFLLPPFSSGRTEAAAELAVRCGANHVFLAGARNGAEVQRLDVVLRVEELRSGRPPAATAIVALADDAGVLAAMSFERCSRRLSGLCWEAHLDVRSDASRLARATIGLAASAAGVIALDSLSGTGDEAAFRKECLAARENGFTGKLCRDLRQIPIVNRIFVDYPAEPAGRDISKTSAPPSA
ncbi:hypothetical protein ACFFP0_18260 [Rhizobium puerariae]|uniref:HpcH/HpaI aldolase/citrate lyase domain-containing protein n=1 Tax=Rhizobium puerariae TaxID=1585791 RepID=A0ABV6AL40_9HYPH